MNQCKHIEDLIIKRSIAPLIKKEQHTIEAHLSNCPACSFFAQKIATIAAFEGEADIQPRRDIKTSLLRRMRSRVPRANFFDRIAELSFRPSFYRAAVVAMLLFLIVLSLPQLHRPSRITPPEYKTAKIDSSLNIINLNQIIQIVDSQKVGMNLREDTVLAKIIYTL